MDLHSKMTINVTRTMTSPVTKTAKMSKWLRHKEKLIFFQRSFQNCLSTLY